MVGINEILIFLAGGIIGFVICRLTLGTKQKTAQQKELDSAKADLEQYKAQVSSHFNDSAKLMGQVASSYQALYTHMAGQSQTLLSDADTQPFPQLKTPSEKEPKDPQAVKEAIQETTQDTTPEAPQSESTEETGEGVSTNDSTQETDKETAEKESAAVSHNDTMEETPRETAEKESTEESSETVSKNAAAAPSRSDK